MSPNLTPARPAEPAPESPSRLSGPFADLAEVRRELWQFRGLLYQLVVRDLKIRYKQAFLGFAWALFLPALTILAGLLLKLAMAHMQGRSLVEADAITLSVKAIPWSFFVGAIGFATPSLVMNMNLITKVYLPREVFPLAATLGQAVDSSLGAVLLIPVAALLGVQAHPALIWVPALAILFFVFTVAMGLLLSCANLFFRDVKYIVQVLLTFGIFFTPVVFEPAMLGERGAWLIMLNPVSPFLEGIRLAVVDGHNLLEPLRVVSSGGASILAWSPWYLAYGVLWSVGGLVVAASLFHRLEFVFAEYI